MTSVSVRFTGSTTNHAALRAVFRDARGPVGQDLNARARRVLTAAKVRAPHKTYRLRSTIRQESGQTAFGQHRDVIAGRQGETPYVGYVVFGTSPHIIRPRRRKALRFSVGGKIVFAQQVHHPGTSPNLWLQRSLQTAR